MTYPRVVRVLAEPSVVFDEVAGQPQGFWVLVALLAVEFVLARTTTLVSDLLRAIAAPLQTVQAVWAGYVNYAIGPAFATLAGGVLLYLLLRSNPLRRLDIMDGAAVLSYAWVPHTLVVILGTLLRSLDWGTPLLPPTPLPDDASLIWRLGRFVCEFAGTAVLCAVAFAQTRSGAPRRRAGNAVLGSIAAAGVLLLTASTGARAHYVRQNWQLVRPVMVGDVMPRFAARGLTTGDTSSEALQGQVVLMDFWASWCGPCVTSMPHLQELHQRLGPRGLKVLAINVEASDPDTVLDFLKRGGYSLPVFSDSGALQEQFHVHLFPTSFLFDRQGMVRAVYQGSADPEALAASIEQLL